MSALTARADWLIAVGLMLLALGYVEWTLARRFRRHELLNLSLYGQLGLTSETAIGMAKVTDRNLSVLRAEVDLAKAQFRELAEKLEIQERRLASIEARYMRAALLYPRASTGQEKP